MTDLTSPTPPTSSLRRRLGLTVLLGILALQAFEVWQGLDFRDVDDLVRTLFARGWREHPYFFPADGYWLTLPTIVRGAWLSLLPAAVLDSPPLALAALRLVTVATLWGCWFLMTEAIRKLGGGRLALQLFTAFFLLNGGTFHFAASNYSEPDATLWTLAALVAVMGGLAHPPFSPRRIALIGLALAAACLSRYEAWFLALLLGGLILWRTRKDPRPLARWAGVLLPAAPIAAWLTMGWLRLGNPLHFMVKNYDYLGANLPPDSLPSLVRCFLQIHSLWLPLAVLMGVAELIRQRARAEARVYALMSGVLIFWSVQRLWSYNMTVRYAWDATLLMAAAGAVGLERACLGRRGRVIRRLTGATIVLSVLISSIMFAWQQPFLMPELCRFGRTVQQRTADGKILFNDATDPARESEIYGLRLLIASDRIIFREWLDRSGDLTPEYLKTQSIRYILGRGDPIGLVIRPPLALEAGSGWTLWRVRE